MPTKTSPVFLNNRKVDRDSYNIFIEGVRHQFGGVYGHVQEHMSKALRHYGHHLLNDDTEHVEQVERQSLRSRHRTTTTPIYGPDSSEDD